VFIIDFLYCRYNLKTGDPKLILFFYINSSACEEREREREREKERMRIKY